ncbi:uncharacterized protein BJ212DRAFT_1487250 [Suillus subaureus]|uniref:Uncharacterized protein n=1 Tax=Suillus subaureus TaxID=48587 RepID=A0A9P7J4Z0_9AGAM|nr:uncharacterized protein BJ212DRAFT_1487250 [Suillus subaureus]KAG1803028.1 hypothetical protein BJ212DRAFT_1487250 [Suillus subaureus]
MFVNGTFDYGGPPHLQASSAITRKKPKVPMSAHTQDDVMGIVAKDTMTTIQKTNLRSEVLIPPPSHPFKLAKRLPTKPVPAPIEILSSTDGVEKPDEEPLNSSNGKIHSEDNADYGDFSHSRSWKLDTRVVQAMKKHVQPIGLEEEMAIENKPSAQATGKAHAKGGHSSPLTVGFSGDEEQQSQPAIDNAAMHLCDGPPDIVKGGQPALTKTMRLLQEDEDSQNNSRAVQPETLVDHLTSVQVTEAPILLAVPSSPCKTELPAKHTGGNGQSGHVQDVPPPLLQNLTCAPSEDICPGPPFLTLMHQNLAMLTLVGPQQSLP